MDAKKALSLLGSYRFAEVVKLEKGGSSLNLSLHQSRGSNFHQLLREEILAEALSNDRTEDRTTPFSEQRIGKKQDDDPDTACAG